MQVKTRIVSDHEHKQKFALPVASATVFEKGQLISYESGYAVKLDAAAEDATFVGVAEDSTQNGVTNDVVVMPQCIAQAAVESASYRVGDALAYNASNDTLESSTANTIAWAYEDTKGGSVTSLLVKFDAIALGKLFAVNS